MATAIMVSYENIISTPTPTVQGVAEYGDNGPANGPDPEYTLLLPSTTDTGRTTWNPVYNENGSWWSGEEPIELSIVPDGQGNDVIQFSVNGETALSETVPSIGNISSIDILAGVQTNAMAAWGDLDITFTNGSSTDEITGENPGVDTTTSDTATAEQVLTVTPDASNNTGLTLMGGIFFSYPAGTDPGPSDLFGAINIYTS
jgi:hypothetical protein